MSIWLGDVGQRPLPSAPRRLRLYILWGQSHIGGAKSFASGLNDTHWPRDGAPLPGTWIWDKWGRTNRYDLSTSDTQQAGEVHGWKAMQAGFGGGGPDYPWIDPGPDPSFGPEIVLAHSLRAHTGEVIAIVKFAVGGSQLANLPMIPNWNVQSVGQGSFSHMQVLVEAYWQPALEAARQWAEAEALELTLGGVISMIGTSDARRRADAEAYGDNLLAAIDYLRGQLPVAQPAELPWLVVQSPRYVDPDGAKLAFIRMVRDAQAAAALARTHVTVRDCVDSRLTGTHFAPEGTAALGQLFFRWAVATAPLKIQP